MKAFGIYLLILISIPSTILSQEYNPGESYFDENLFVEYINGNLPIIISAPHGGEKRPDELEDRNCSGCVYINDSYTQELAREITENIYNVTRCYPHVILNRLHRSKLDANRNIVDGADEDPLAEEAWTAYHTYVAEAKVVVENNLGKGLFIDLHGHAHNIQRLELGYLISKNNLQLSDETLNEGSYGQNSSINNLTQENEEAISFSELLRGELSLGSIIDSKGFDAVPSDAIPFPNTSEAYFSGGYNTSTYGSKNAGSIDAIQIECNQDVRFQTTIRKKFADSLARSLIEFVEIHYLNEGELSCIPVSQKETFNYLKVYPNPTNGKLFINTNLEWRNAKLTSLMGFELLSISNSGLSNELDLDPLQNGIYLLEIIDASGNRKSIKVMKNQN